MERLNFAASRPGELSPQTAVHHQAGNDLRSLRLRGLGHVAVDIYVARGAAPRSRLPRPIEPTTPKETR
jgi:hypothetical protein